MRTRRNGSILQLSFLPRLFPVNCYLVEEEKDITLVDAALPFSSKGILEAASKLGKPIRRIVLTHAHDDHVGALDQLKLALPDAAVYISPRDARLLRGDRSLLPNEPNTPIKGGVPKSVQTAADYFITAGERIGSLEAIPAPGHTPGSFAFLDTRTRALLAGDAFQVRGGIAVSGTLKWMFPFTALATWHPDIALDSAKKLRELSPSLLAVGHGVMIEQPLATMTRAINEAERLAEKRRKLATRH